MAPSVRLIPLLAALWAWALPPAPAQALSARSFQPSWISAQAASGPLVYVADSAAGSVLLYPADRPDPAPVGEITGLGTPTALAVDRHGNLYVTDPLANTLRVFARGALRPALTYRIGLSGPTSVSVDSDDTIYVGNTNQSAQGSVVVYRPGRAQPVRVIDSFFGGSPTGIALDAQHTLYVAYTFIGQSSFSGIKRFAAGDNVGRDQGIRIAFTGGLVLDPRRDYIICDQSNSPGAILAYAQQTTRPIRSVAINGFPYYLAFDRTYRYVYNVNSLALDAFAYPSGKLAFRISRGFTSAGDLSGVALSPAPAAP